MFESRFVRNPEDRFCYVEAHINVQLCEIYKCDVFEKNILSYVRVMLMSHDRMNRIFKLLNFLNSLLKMIKCSTSLAFYLFSSIC